ncbi:FecR family protein [Lunatimonas salinarum]|uniref:FecR family protein n=1 Tax=Lunatimonas salinarum TaxID=1774590 RepID=UPI001ADFF4C5|nr:FecR domain-containing protein [Lunatimonas salinarum]
MISDEEFVRWVLDPSPETTFFWENWRKNHAKNQQEFERAVEFIQRLDFGNQRLSESECDELLLAILNVDPSRQNSAVFFGGNLGNWFAKQWVRVAAILLLSFMGAFIANQFLPTVIESPTVQVPTMISVDNPKGQKSLLKLPDGTMVHLSHASSLVFPEYFSGDARRVELIGEAFFDVVHIDSIPFMVVAEGVELEVLGTSFNVNASAHEFNTRVSLVTGSLRVNLLDTRLESKNHLLVPGEELSLDRKSGTYSVGSFNVDATIAWKEGVLLFKDAGMSEFFDELEKWYGVNIQLFGSPQKEWQMNGRYDNEKLEDILLGLQFVYPIEYQIKGNNVTIKFTY